MITSLSNPRIKIFRSLLEKKNRQQSGLFFIEGIRIVGEAVQTEAEIEFLVYAPELLRSDFGLELIQQLQTRGMEVFEVSASVFLSIARKDGPQGLAAVVRQRWMLLEDLNICPPATWVALDSVADPGNLGTIMRTHDATGGTGIIILDQATDPYDPQSVRASMGALFSQSLIKGNLEQFSDWKRNTGYVVVGASGATELDYQDYLYPERLVLLMGSERMGLQPRHTDICDRMVRIPMVGRSDSLNLAVATSVILYEIFNQHKKIIQN